MGILVSIERVTVVHGVAHVLDAVTVGVLSGQRIGVVGRADQPVQRVDQCLPRLSALRLELDRRGRSSLAGPATSSRGTSSAASRRCCGSWPDARSPTRVG